MGAVMLFSFAVRSVYMESCSMSSAAAYIVVRDSIGPTVAVGLLLVVD
jgi:hypothetical protein